MERPSQRSHRSQRSSSGESGQAVVEAALILPAMIFLILCILQLTLLQQARLMVEYAAFSAARAGVVHNMDNGAKSPIGAVDGPMRDAAVWSILPSFARTDSFASLGAARLRYEAQDTLMRAAGLPQIRVAVLNPHVADFNALGAHLNRQEIDFDDVRPQAQGATLLSLQVRYLFELKVPFANKMVQSIWFASQVGLLRLWQGVDLTSPRIGGQRGQDAVERTGNVALGRGTLNDGMPGGLNVSALATLSRRNRFFLPVNAWYTMRLQSNPFKKWAAP